MNALGGIRACIDPMILCASRTIGATMVDLLTRPDILEGAKAEFAERTGGGIGGAGLSGTFRDTLAGVDPRLPDNELLIGVLAGDEAWAFPLEAIPADAPMQASVGGVPIVIFEDALGIPSHAYHRLLSDGTTLDFTRTPEGAIRDVQTGSSWHPDGLALDGELAGVQLAFVTSFFTEWYGWAAFHPDTLIYAGEG